MGPRKYNMLVYNCIVSGSEMLSDAHEAEEMWGGTWLKVKGTYITIGGEEDIDIGGNASAEEEAEGTDDNSAQVVDIINNFSLQPMEYSKKQYMSYIKPFLKKCVMYMKENDRADEVDEFKANVQTAIKEITPSGMSTAATLTSPSSAREPPSCAGTSWRATTVYHTFTTSRTAWRSRSARSAS